LLYSALTRFTSLCYQRFQLEAALAKQETTIEKQQKQIEALATVQEVSDQIALSKPAPQLAANP
jgi:hypothetical protein